MRLKVITCRTDENGVFDSAELEAFCEEHDAVAASDHFYVLDGRPFLAILLRFSDPRSIRKTEVRRPELEVPGRDKALFETIRRWRNDRARREGRPAYVLFNNAQLLAIAAARPRTREALGAIDGIGDARVRDYAEDLLALVAVDDAERTAGG